jgi:hypothetical protein
MNKTLEEHKMHSEIFNTEKFNAVVAKVLEAEGLTVSTELTDDNCEDVAYALKNAAWEAVAKNKDYRGELNALSTTNENTEVITDENVEDYWDEEDECFILAGDGVVAFEDMTLAKVWQVGDYIEDCNYSTVQEVIDMIV